MEPRASTALTTAGMAALRRAAAMAHTVGGDHAAAVGRRRAPRRGAPRSGRPARAVAPRHRPVRLPDGRRPGVGRLRGRARDRPHRARPDDELDIDWAVAAAGPGPRLRRRAGRLRRPRSCGRSRRSSTRRRWARSSPTSATGSTTSSPGAVDGLSARLVRDDLLGATVVHVEAGPAGTEAVLDEVLRRMVAVVGTAELLDALA